MQVVVDVRMNRSILLHELAPEQQAVHVAATEGCCRVLKYTVHIAGNPFGQVLPVLQSCSLFD